MITKPIQWVTLIFFLLMGVTIWWWRQERIIVPSSIRQTGRNHDATPSSLSSATEETEPPAPRGKRPDLPKNASETGLPEVQGEEIARSAVHTRIPAGHSMVTGGYQTEGGHHEFVVLTPKWLETASGNKQIMLESRILNADQEALLKTGLNSLVTGEQKMQQNAEVWTPDDVTNTLTNTEGLDLLSSPSIVVNPGGSAQVRMGNEKTAFMLDLEISEAPDGGFELKSDIKRVK